MGLGGIQKRVRDVILDISKNRPDWKIYLLVKDKKPDYFSESIKECENVIIKYYDKSFFNGLTWTVKEYLTIKPDVFLTFLVRFSVMMVWLKKIFFWQKTKIILNEGILTSRYLETNQKNRIGLWRFLVRISYGLADKVIVPAMACKLDLILNLKVPDKKIIVVKNWTLYEEKNTTGKEDLIYVGRLDSEKKIMNFIPIIEKLKNDFPKVKLYLLGKGEQEKLFIKIVKQKKLEKNIKVIGFSNEVSKYLCNSKIFVLPSINEGLPNVVLEAAMCGVPTVSNNFIGVEEVIIDGKTGYVSSNVDEMVEKIKILLIDEEKRKVMGDKAKKFVQKEFGKSNQDKFIEELLSA